MQGINREVVLAEMPFSDTILAIVREWIGAGRRRFGETHYETGFVHSGGLGDGVKQAG